MESLSANNTGRGLRLIELSNYAGRKANAMRRERREKYDIASARHQMLMNRLELEHVKTRLEATGALKDFRLFDAWHWWREARRVGKVLGAVRSNPPIMRSADIEERQARAGDEAERRLDEFLAGALDEKWTLIAGYSGRNGEIDRILIGPFGIHAFEIKGNRGVIHSDGERWWVERYGRYGDLLNTKALHRAPDAQLARAVMPLEAWLRKNGVLCGIKKVVLFTAEDARIGRIFGTQADVVSALNDLDLGNLINPSTESVIEPRACERIANLVVRDHAFWERRRPGNESEVSRPSCAGL